MLLERETPLDAGCIGDSQSEGYDPSVGNMAVYITIRNRGKIAVME